MSRVNVFEYVGMALAFVLFMRLNWLLGYRKTTVFVSFLAAVAVVAAGLGA